MTAHGKIGVATATIIGMNAMIGSGIFTAPATMAAYVGPAGILAYIFVIISVWFIAQSFARVASLFPEEGSFYAYTKQWAGHRIGLFAGFFYLFGLLIAMGLLAQMAGTYLEYFIPYSPFTLGICALIALVFLNMFGVALSQAGQIILIISTLFPLLAITLLCLTKSSIANLSPFVPYGFTNVLKATRVVIFGFFGFECAASLFSIVESPQKNVPRALTYSILIIGVIYTLFVSSIILSTPLNLFTDPRTPLSVTLDMLFPSMHWFITVIHFSILSAIVGTIHSMVWSSSALLVALSHKIRCSWVQTLNSRGYINQRSSAFFVGLCILLSYITLKNPDLFFSLTALGIITAFLLSITTLLTMRSEWQSGQNIKTIIGMSTALVILYFAAEGLVHELVQLW